jgi:hypothetical protein
MFDFSGTIKSLWEWLVSYLRDIINDLLAPLADNLPDLDYDLSGLSDILSFVNSWIALDWACYLLGVYFVFITVMIGVKLSVKLFIPTVG